MKPRFFLLACVALPLSPVSVAAQDGFGGREVVQPLPPPAAQELKEALGRLARDPRNLDALIAAGTASLELDDVDAAVGFFGRAAELSPDDPRIKAGKAAAYVRTRRPDEALRLFQEAEASGVEIVKLAGDYGLAWDLVGNNKEAQLRYQRALAAAPGNEEVSRRLALSYAIDGQEQAFEATLRPLLEKRDFAAYRTRAFGLAILDKPDDAVAITEAVMDRPMATKLEPYLRFMPQLTKAQQAAAANLGLYPTASRIGRDDPRIAALSDGPATGRAARASDSGLAPAGTPLGSAPVTVAAAEPAPAPQKEVVGVIVGSRDEAERTVRVARREAATDPLSRTSDRPRIVERRREDEPAKQPPPGPPPVVAAAETTATARPAVQPAVSSGTMRLPEATSGAELAPASTQPPVATPAQPVVVARMEPSSAAPGFDLGRVSGSGTGPSLAAPPAPKPDPAPEPASVADAFADLSAPPIRAARTPAAGAVDIAAIKAPREVEKREEAKPAPKPEPPKPAAPSRFWVQVATGQDKSALKFDWRRLSKQADGLLDGKGPFVTAWGQTNRLLAGPYKTRDEARKALKDLQEKGFDAFTFTSPEGQEIAELR
ncbi:SPOR domain-containing protein [Erythrobacter sp. SDW2]|uniref:SPOR domain-containing protein n=1 Tax=Erythrobacter sp. SDW2 TaxID=2907154 RepID=UPI001F1C7AEE|nr:SPOR domain-containing protein [Erythrobacter sp. SDW2]UIP06476.1 SPOR domain-containing protein [Erythrobacter sp. SDW2]